jgi:transcriptional regulator GlxA family with amidase domain
VESVSEPAVVFVAFDGVQPIDVVGPHEVFAGAGDAAASLGRRGGYKVRVASARGGLIRTESGLELGTMPLPGPGERIDTLVLPGGTGSRAASADDTIDVVAERCGLGSAESLRRVFNRHLGVSPDAYRRRFRTTTHHEGAST